jgi:hypothetical protein
MADHHPLSGDEIKRHPIAHKYPFNLVEYSQLNRVRTIDQLFGDKSAVILLYNTVAVGNGHWILLIKHVPDCAQCTRHGSNFGPGGTRGECPHGVIEYFDPYGSSIDFVLSLQDRRKRFELKQSTAKLSHLLGESPYCIVYNDQALQSRGQSVETCGHHCLARLRNRHLDVDEYAKKLRAMGKPDKVVVQMYHQPVG